jgi:hypothetical protein
VTSRSARDLPPLVLMIYAPDGGGNGEDRQGSGFRVAEGQTVEQAVTLLPDLIVLDFGLNSDLVARLRRETTTTSAIAIIALDISTLHERGAGKGSTQRGAAS